MIGERRAEFCVSEGRLAEANKTLRPLQAVLKGAHCALAAAAAGEPDKFLPEAIPGETETVFARIVRGRTSANLASEGLVDPLEQCALAASVRSGEAEFGKGFARIRIGEIQIDKGECLVLAEEEALENGGIGHATGDKESTRIRAPSFDIFNPSVRSTEGLFTRASPSRPCHRRP